MSILRVSCEHCGSEIRPGKKFCSRCGQLVMPVVLQFCEQCGAKIRPGKKFCAQCGQPALPAILHNRYRITGILGRGGMSTIYKAEDNNLGQRPVAVKKMKLSNLQSREEFDQVLGAFEQEAMLLAKLNHSYLPNIYDHFSENKDWYIVMQYIEGETLHQRLHAIPGGYTSPRDAIDIGIKLCEVLGYLHTQKPPVIFSDLKPDNIMLTPEGNLYLIDFGIARLYKTTLTDERKFVSQGYSPPEQYQSTRLSPHADIYSLGATLHQMLTGHNPAQSNGFAPLQLGSQLWAKDLEALVRSMLKQNVEERPANITVVRQALQRIADLHAQAQLITGDTTAWPTGTSVWGSAPQESTTFGNSPSGWTTPSLSNIPTVPVDSPFFPSPLPQSWTTPVGVPFWSAPPAFPDAEPATRTHPFPASVTSSSLKLSLHVISALAWSPDGSRLAAANKHEIHVYAWPPEEYEFTFEDERLIPLRTWPLAGLQSAADAESDDEGYYDWSRVSTVPVNRIKIESLAIAWSSDSVHLAVAGEALKSEMFILNTNTEEAPVPYEGQKSPLLALSWSPEGQFLAVGGNEHIVQVKEVQTQRTIFNKIHAGSVTALAWSPDGKYLASASSDGMVHVWEVRSGQEICTYQGHSEYVHDILWATDGRYIISCGEDHTIQVWDAKSARKLRSLETHTNSVQRIAFLDQARLLVSLSRNGTVRMWETENWAEKEVFKTTFDLLFQNFDVAFHPSGACLAKPTSVGIVTMYEIDPEQVYNGPVKVSGIQYTNAKVVLLGDSGVGKTGLGLALSRQGFHPTESTHGRTVWTFALRESKLDDGRKEVRETLLWDLAGQPGYRLIHQLHLNEVALALVVFDAHSEMDPFAGIFHWVRALRTAQRVRGNMGAMKMLLVLARIDRGGRRVSQDRIDELIQKLGFDGYFETSAREGTNIATLVTAIKKTIDWEQLPKVTSTELFQHIKAFLVAEKQAGQLLSTEDNLYRGFLRTWQPQGRIEDLHAEFVTGIILLGKMGLIRQLSFGNLVLLQPELLDSYASALVNAVRDEPDGLGSISEEAVREGKFSMPADERIGNPEQEKLLLIAMAQDLLSYEIALREQGEDGAYLIFPSESTRENPALPDPEGASVIFTFEGPVLNIYTSLVVRLSHSSLFSRKELWRNAVSYEGPHGRGICGIWLKMIEDGKGELTLFFDEHVSPEMRFHFEEFVQLHLERKALHESIKSRRIFKCPSCNFVASDQLVRERVGRGFNWFKCPICETRVNLLDRKGPIGVSSRISEMDRAADMQRNRAASQLIVQGKRETRDFDVFLCYHGIDQTAVIDTGEHLKERGILPWLDIWELRPGLPWQRLLEQQIGYIKSAAVFVGKDGIGPWQQMELEAFLREFVNRGNPVIPILLPDAPAIPQLPIFLKGMTWVDFRKQDEDHIERLIWGITGERNIY